MSKKTGFSTTNIMRHLASPPHNIIRSRYAVSSNTRKARVCHYQQEPKSEIGKDPLIWWNANQGKYPRLYKLAMKTLSAQATEVPSERAFSAAGLMHTKLRRSMLPNTLCQRLFVYANHPSLLESRQYQENESDTSDDEQ